jgi:hypothetical protein
MDPQTIHGAKASTAQAGDDILISPKTKNLNLNYQYFTYS